MGRRLPGFVGVVLSLAGFGLPLNAADHRDGPRVTDNAAINGNLDLNDLYVFVSPANRNNTVIVLSTGGAGVGLLTPPIFAPGAVYEIRVSNDGDPTTDELVYQFIFSDPDNFLRQAYTVTEVNERTGRARIIARSVTGRNSRLLGGGQVHAGIVDDPFFFDVIAFGGFRTAVQQGRPLADRVAPFLPPSIPNNFFGNFNILGIIVEVPRTRLQSRASQPDISVWIRDLLPDGTQFDRMGNPGINTAVGFSQLPASPFPNIQDIFNGLTPADDPALVPEAAARINSAFGLPLADATALAEFLLPDVVHFNTRDRGGFPNGRRLADDVIDIELDLLTGGALTSDRVINDSVFSRRFPYVGAALPRDPIRESSAIEAIRALEPEGGP